MLLNAASRRRLMVLLVACLAAVFGGIVTMGDASAKPPVQQTTATQMKITGIAGITGAAVPGGLPVGALPSVLAQPGTPLTVSVALSTADGTAASFNSDTAVTISTSAGTLSSSKDVIPANQSLAELHTSLAGAVNNVRLTVTVAKGSARGLGASAPNEWVFDVLTDIRTESASARTPFIGGIGGDDGQCTNATPANPVCAVVQLPSGATSGVLLSTGLCNGYGCNIHGALIQTLFGNQDTGGTALYDSTHPATLILKCDKTLCGGGAIKNVPVDFTLAGNGPLERAPACTAKATVAKGQSACVDYVQSTRDGAGDTILYLLFVQDMRGSVG